MLRYLRVLLIALPSFALTSVPLNAQRVLAVEAGLSVAKLGGSDAGSNTPRTGLSAGASLTLPVTEILGIQVGAAYVQKGATDNSTGVNAELAIDYFEVPVLLRVGIPSASKVSAHILVGPAVSFLTQCNAKGSSGGVNVSIPCAQLPLDTKNVDFGAMGGVGLGFEAAPKFRITVDALYNLGLTSFDNTGTADVKNRAFTLRAGLGLVLG